MFGKRSDFLNFLLVVFCVFWSNFVVSEQKYYYVKLDGDSAVLKMYINDAEVVSKLGRGEMNYNINANQYLMSGDNRIVIDFEPYNLSRKNYTFDSELFYLDVGLTMNSSNSEELVELMNLRFNGKSDSLYQFDGPKKSQRSRINNSKTMVFLSDVRIKEHTIQYANRISEENSKRVVIEFSINDEGLVKPSWIDAKKINDVDSSVEKKLWASYEKIYKIIKNNDELSYKKKLLRVNKHLSNVINYDIDEFADEVLGKDPLNVDGLFFGDDFYLIKEGSHFVRVSPDKKMLSIVPNPLTYKNNNDEYVSEKAMYFCDFGDELEVCYIYDTGY
ncbi:hypothetical protein [Neptunomonas phycophila]|uniref:hypothetical protein n=1 Tax=Neptunomonas phycophila TaxID=1572645 RepID=UPI0030FBA792